MLLEEVVQVGVNANTLYACWAFHHQHACAGLDSFAALNIMDHMACLAALGHTVIATLHQPRTAIWNLLHQARCSPVLLRSMPSVASSSERTDMHMPVSAA